jgi:dGTPase
LRSGLLTIEQLSQVAIFARHMEEVRLAHPKIDARRLVHETVRRMIGTLVTDLTNQSAKNIKARSPRNIDDVRTAEPLIAFSAGIERQQQELKRFLRRHLYQHHQVARMTNKARRIVSDLFRTFYSEPRLMPPQYHALASADTARTVADYIAGMTDRYAIREYRRIYAVDDI